MNTPRLAFLIALTLAPSPLASQGFDCAKAQTPVEKLICAAPEIGALDKTLNAAVQARLAAAPNARGEFIADSRRWLAARDKACPVPEGRLSAGGRSAAIACLAKSYRARLDAIAAIPPAQTTAPDPDKALCQRLAEVYRGALATRTNDLREPEALLNQSPFELLASKPDAGVARAPAASALPETSPQALDRWGRGQTPPVRFPANVKREILELGSSAILTIDHAPGTNFYTASQVQGTAHCVYTTAFTVRDGVAHRAAKPLWSDQPGDSCGVDQFFGVIDGRTVAVQDYESPYEPSLAARLTLKAWNTNAFGPACSVSFDFDPVFADLASEPAQEPDRKCDSDACVKLKPAALALVKAVQRDPLAARKDAIDRLSSAQRMTFAAMEKRAQDIRGDVPAPDAPASPASYLDQSPLLLPLLHQDDVYLASVGHYTIGWRIYPDWSVKLEKLDQDKLTVIGTAAVAMRRGALRSAKVD